MADILRGGRYQALLGRERWASFLVCPDEKLSLPFISHLQHLSPLVLTRRDLNSRVWRKKCQFSTVRLFFVGGGRNLLKISEKIGGK
jgi:hypothetical protein